MLCSLDDIMAPIETEIAKPQDCKAMDMLHFLFSSCNAGGDTAQVESKDGELMDAFEMAQELVNEPKTLKSNLDLV